MPNQYDTIIIGSGMGGLSCASALSQFGHKVLVLEQHSVAGGLTHTFARNGFTWDVGVHYLGEMARGSTTRRILDWLSDGAIEMVSTGETYDIMHFPDDFTLAFSQPAGKLVQTLKAGFPESTQEIDRFFALCARAERTAVIPFRLRALPKWIKPVYARWKQTALRRFWGRTTARVLEETISDPRLRAVLAAQWGDHGSPPREGSFAMQAMILRHYLEGAWYPAGGAASIARALLAVIEQGGGETRIRTRVEQILLKRNRVTGVKLTDGSEIRANKVVSNIGARDTVRRLLPESIQRSGWSREILGFKPSLAHVCLHLGFEGDIAAHGASRANHWIYEDWDVNQAIWDDPGKEFVPMLFVSFPSLKDPRHEPGARQRHTGEIITWINWQAFQRWQDSSHGQRPEAYRQFKQDLQAQLLNLFAWYFPKLTRMIAYSELSTPLSTEHFVQRARGAVYGLETTPKRFLSRALDIRTPVKGLYLSGQDVVTPGVAGAMMGGVLAAATIDPRVFAKLKP